jgi:hypothetical protein
MTIRRLKHRAQEMHGYWFIEHSFRASSSAYDIFTGEPLLVIVRRVRVGRGNHIWRG